MTPQQREARTIATLFDVEQAGNDRFDAVVPPTDGSRAFGGHLMGLATRAAAQTLPGGPAAPHSLHARFVRSAVTGQHIACEVERVHDGRTISVRRVVLRQDGRTVLLAEMSFHGGAAAAGEWQRGSVDSAVPPEAVPNPMATATPLAPFEIRAEHTYVRGEPVRLHPYWARLREPVPDDPVLPACVLAILTDVGVSASARRPGSVMRVQRNAVSLDHALWLHRPFALGDWLRVDAVAESNADSRGFARGTVFTADGALVASFGQEVMLDPR